MSRQASRSTGLEKAVTPCFWSMTARVELTAENESGVLQELARVDVGSYFGAMGLLTGEDRTENATAIRNTNLWVLYRSDLEELVGRLPDIGEALDQAAGARSDSRPETADGGVTAERLRRFPLLANLDINELREVARHLKQAHLRPGEQVFRAGAPSDALYFIERGVVRLQLLNGAGSWTRGEGEVFGEKAILSDEPYGQSAFAETDADLLFVEYPGLAFLKSRLPSVATDLHRILSQPAGREEVYAEPPPPARHRNLRWKRRKILRRDDLSRTRPVTFHPLPVDLIRTAEAGSAI